MRIEISEQCLYFLVCILLGALIAFCYEPIKLIRAFFKHPNWLISLFDFFFCIPAAVGFIFVTYALSYGEIRWFGVVGTFGGAILFRFSIGRLIQKITPKLVFQIRRFASAIRTRLVSPLLTRVRDFRDARLKKRVIRKDQRIRKRLIRSVKRGF